jgi:hypothetical protein
MPQLNTPIYRRDYTGEVITYVEDAQMKSLFVTPREFSYDRSVSNAIVLGNGLSRLEPEIQLILKQNNNRVAEGYKTTYACNAAYRDTPADYYIWKTNIFFGDTSFPIDVTKVFLPNNLWLSYRDTNLIPNIWYMDSGSTAAFMAAFDGAKKVFLFGFDGSEDVTNDNIYQNTLGYNDNQFNHDKHSSHLSNVVRVFSDVQFYRLRTYQSCDLNAELLKLENYREVSVREAVLLGDF